MARSDIGVRVRAVGLDKSIVKQARAGERVVASKPIKLKLDAKGFALPLGRITGQMSEFQKSLDASAARVFAFGAAVGVINSVGNAFKALIKDSIELNKSLTELNSIFKLTSKNLQQFGGDLFDVARNTGQAFSEVTDAATEFSRQGLTAAETLKRLNDAMVLTRLSGLQATDSVKYLTAAINGFNKEALSSTEIVNRLANVDAGFAVSSRDLADAISRSGASAQAAKVEFNELLAIVTSVQQQTARGGAVIGNAFKTIFTRLQRSSVRGALEDIGVATENANGSLRSATAILVDYAKAYQTLTDQQRAYTAEQVAGVRQVNNLKALITDMAGQYGIYNRALGTANSTTNEATRRNEEYNKTIAAMAHQTSLSVKEMSAAIGELTMGAGAERVLGMIQSIADFFNKVLDPQEGNRLAQGFMKGIGAYIAGPGLILIGGAFLKLFTIMGKLGVDAVKSIFAVNTETQRRRALEEAILALLIKEENAMNKLQAAGVTQAQKEKIVLDLLRQQTAERQRQASFLASLSGLPGLKGVAVSKQGHVVGSTPKAAANLRPRAEGHVPNFSTMAKSMEVIQAVGLGAPKGTKALKGKDRVGNYYYNDQEVRVSAKQLGGMGLNSKGRDLILPTYGASKQENLKKVGGKLGMSASDAEGLFMGSAQGFVPNFRGPMPRESMTFTQGKGLVSGKQKGAKKVGTYAPNVGAVVSQAPKGMGHAFQAKGRVGLSNAGMRKVLEPIAGPYRGNYFADFSFPVGGLRQADFRKELKAHFKFEEFVASLGFGAGNKPKMVHTNLESAMDKVGRNQGLGRIFEAAILQGLRMQDLPEEGTWDIPNWQGSRGKYTLGLPSKTKDVDVKYNIMETKGNKTMVTMFQKALVSRPKMRNQIGRNIRNKEGHTMSKRRATGFVPNFAVTPVRALGYEKATADYIKTLNTRQLSGLMAKTKSGDPYPTIPKDFINPLTGQKYESAQARREAVEADFKKQGPLYRAVNQRHTAAIATQKVGASIEQSKGREAEARRMIFGLTSPQTAGVIAPTPGLKGIQKGDYAVPGFGKIKMGYRMFGYNDSGPAAQQMGNLDHSVRNWSKNKASALSNLMTPGKHLFEKFASEGGISGAVGSIFETAVQMALRLPAFKKETGSFDYAKGSGEISALKKGGLFPGLTGDWLDASVNPADKPHMFKKIFNSIVLGGKQPYFRQGKNGNFVPTGKKMPTIPSKGRGGRYGAGKAFTLADGFVPNFASWVWDSDVFQGSGSKPYPRALDKLLNSGKPVDVAVAPSGAGKTYWGANKFGMERFIKTDAQLMQAVRAGGGDRIMALSAMGQTKAGGLSPMSQKLLDASVRTGGTREYLYRSNMQLLANRNMRMSGGAHSMDPRSVKQLAGVKRAPLNQFGFLSLIRKKYGMKIRKLNEGFVPNFTGDIYDQIQTSLKTESALTGRDSALGYDSRVGLGVYDPATQSSLTTAITRDHLGRGQSLGEAMQSSAKAQQTMAFSAAGFIPNFGRGDNVALPYFARYSPDQQVKILNEMASKGQRIPLSGMPTKAQVQTAAKSAKVGDPEIKSTKSAGLQGKSAAPKIAIRTEAARAQLQSYTRPETPGAKPRLRYEQVSIGPTSAEAKERSRQGFGQPSSKVARESFRQSVAAETTAAQQTQAARDENKTARNEEKKFRDQEAKERKKEARQGRMQMGLLGLSMAGPVLSEMVGKTEQGDVGGGAIKGALSGVGMGAMVPMMMNNPAGWAIGGGIVAFSALKEAMGSVQQSSESLGQELDDENAKRQQNINAANRFIQAQNNLNQAYKTGNVKLQIKNQEDLINALNKIGDPKIRTQIIAAGGDLEKLGKVIANLGETSERRTKIAGTLKSMMENTDKRTGFAGRGSIGESISKMRKTTGEGFSGDFAEGVMRVWGAVGRQKLTGGGKGDSVFNALTKDAEDIRGSLGTRLHHAELEEVGEGISNAVRLTNVQVKEAYELLGKNTVESSRKILTDYFQLSSKETNIVMDKLDFSSGEVADMLEHAIRAEEKMIVETAELEAAMLSGAASLAIMDGEISRTADVLHQKMQLVSEGFKKMSKTLTTIRKSSVSGLSAMGVMTQREASDDIMKFQEDIILQQAQLDTENVLRELLTETKDFNNKALKEAYQGSISTDFSDPLSFQGEKIISILNRDSELIKGTQAATLDLVSAEAETLIELKKININSALSLIELRSQSLAARKEAERKSFSEARDPLTLENVLGLRQGFKEMLGTRGRPSIASEAETFDRLKSFFKVVEERFGVKSEDIQSGFFKDAMKSGGQFQELYNLLHFADELGGFTALNTDMRARMDDAPPANMENRQQQQKWLVRNILGAGGLGLGDTDSIAKLFPGVSLDPGQTVADLYASKDPAQQKMVADVRDQIIGGMFTGDSAERLKGDPRFETIVEMIGKSLLRMITTAKLENLSKGDLEKHTFNEEKGFLQKAINDLMKEGKLEVKDIQKIFGTEVDAKGEIKSTTERGLNVVKALVKDLATIKTPEFKTLTAIQSNTGDTARLLHDYLTLESRNERAKLAEKAATDRREFVNPKLTELSNTTTSLGGFGKEVPGESGEDFVYNLEPRKGISSGAAFYTRLTEVGGGPINAYGMPSSRQDKVKTLRENKTNKDVKNRGQGRGLWQHSIPAIMGDLDNADEFNESIASLLENRFGRTAFAKATTKEKKEAGFETKEDLLLLMVETIINEAKTRAKSGKPIAANIAPLSAEWFEKASKDSDLVGGENAALSNIALEGENPLANILQLWNNMRAEQGKGPEGWGEFSKWLKRPRSEGGPGLREPLIHSDGSRTSQAIAGHRDKSYILGESLRENLKTQKKTTIEDVVAKLQSEKDRLNTLRTEKAGAAHLRGGAWEDLEMPDFSNLDNEELIQAIKHYEQMLGQYESALAQLPEDSERENRKASVQRTFEADHELAQAAKIKIEDRLKVATGELSSVLEQLKEDPTNRGLLDQKEARTKEVEDLQTRHASQEEAIDRIISQRDQSIANIDAEALIIASSLEGAATKLENLPGTASAISKALVDTVEIFKQMQKELSELGTGKTPPRLRGKDPAATWFQNMSKTFQDIWSTKKKTNAAGFIPNFAADPAEQRALRTESAMGGPTSRPKLGWSDRIAKLRGGDGRMVFDPGNGQKNENVALRQHSASGESLATSIRNSAIYQEARGNLIPQFQQAPAPQFPATDQVIDAMFARLGTPQGERGAGRRRLQQFLTRVGYMESDYDSGAQNRTTSASGTFQFTRGSAVTATNRLENLLDARGLDLPAWASTFRTNVRGTTADRAAYGRLASGLSDDHARALTLANLDQAVIPGQPGRGDMLLRQIISGDPGAAGSVFRPSDRASMAELYRRIHHTNPDQATLTRMATGGYFHRTPTAAGLNAALTSTRGFARGFIPNFNKRRYADDSLVGGSRDPSDARQRRFAAGWPQQLNRMGFPEDKPLFDLDNPQLYSPQDYKNKFPAQLAGTHMGEWHKEILQGGKKRGLQDKNKALEYVRGRLESDPDFGITDAQEVLRFWDVMEDRREAAELRSLSFSPFTQEKAKRKKQLQARRRAKVELGIVNIQPNEDTPSWFLTGDATRAQVERYKDNKRLAEEAYIRGSTHAENWGTWKNSAGKGVDRPSSAQLALARKGGNKPYYIGWGEQTRSGKEALDLFGIKDGEFHSLDRASGNYRPALSTFAFDWKEEGGSLSVSRKDKYLFDLMDEKNIHPHSLGFPKSSKAKNAQGFIPNFAADFIPNFVDPDVKIPFIALDKLKVIGDTALDAQGHPKGFHSTIEKILADEDAVKDIAKRLGVRPDQVPALVHKNIQRGNIPQQTFAADKAAAAWPKPSSSTLLPPGSSGSGGGLTKAGLQDWTNKPGKKVQHVEQTLRRYISQELAGAALLEKAGIPSASILGSTEHGVIKADLSKSHIDLEDWYNTHTVNSPAAPKPGSSQAVKDAWSKHQKPRQVLDLLQMKFRSAAEGAGLTGRGKPGHIGRAMDMRATNFMVPKNVDSIVETALKNGDSVDDIAEKIWQSREMKFVDPGFVATNAQIDAFEKGHDITTDIRRTGPPPKLKQGSLSTPRSSLTAPSSIDSLRNSIAEIDKEIARIKALKDEARLANAVEGIGKEKLTRSKAGVKGIDEGAQKRLLAEWQRDIRAQGLAPDAPPKGATMWKKLGRLVPFISTTLGLWGAKTYSDQGDDLRAALTTIGAVPGAEMADLAALGIDLGELLLWGGPNTLSPAEEGMMLYLKEKGLLADTKRNFFGKPEEGGVAFRQIKDYALMQLQIQETMKSKGLTPELGPQQSFDVDSRNEILAKESVKLEALARMQKFNADFKARQEKYTIPEGWDKHYAPWEAEQHEEMLRDIQIAKMRKELKEGPRPTPGPRKLTPSQAAAEAEKNEQIKKKNEETRKAWKEYWDKKREGGYVHEPRDKIPELAPLVIIGRRDGPTTVTGGSGGDPGVPQRLNAKAGGFIPNFAPIDSAAKAKALSAERAVPGTRPEFRNWPFPHVADAASQGVEGPSGWAKTMKDHKGEGLSQAIANSARMQNAAQENSIPNFAPARTATDEDVAESVARFTKTSKRDVKNRGDLRALPRFNEDVWRSFHLMTMGYPEKDIKVKEGEEWRGIKGPTTVYGKNTLTKRMQARLQEPISGYEFNNEGKTIRAMYYSDLSGPENDTVVLGKQTYSNLSRGIRFKEDVESLNNELTHFIQDNVLKAGGTMAPASSRKIGSRTIGYSDQERLLMQDNIEALAWTFYRKHRHKSDGGLGALKEFAEWENNVYGKKHQGWNQVYGGNKVNQQTSTLKLFKEIAAAHGDSWGTNKISTNKSPGATYASLKDYHEANKNRPEWMDNLGDTGMTKLRDFTEIQSSYIGRLSTAVGAPPKTANAQEKALQQAAIGQGVDVWKLGHTGPAGAQVALSLEGELDTWRKAKQVGNIWSEPEKAEGPMISYSPYAPGGPKWGEEVPPLIATNRGVVDSVGGLQKDRARRFKRRSVRIPPGSLAGGFIPNFMQSFTGAMRGTSDESFLPNFGILQDELDQIDGGLYPHKTVDWWRNLRNKGWNIGGDGTLAPPQGQQAPDLGKWTHPLMGISKGKHRKHVDSSVRFLSNEYLDSIPGEAPEEREARISQFAANTISETDPLKNFPRAKGLMYRAMHNITGGMPPEMRSAVWARYKEREKLPWHIMGVEDGLLQKTGANYDTRSNTMILSKKDVGELRTSSVSPELRERFMKQFIVQMQDEVLREVGTLGSDYLRGERVGSMKIKGAQFGDDDPWSAGQMEHVMETTGFSQEESEWGRRAADNLLWKMWDSASSTTEDDDEFIRRIDQVAEEEKNWAGVRKSFGVGSLMDSRSTSTNAFGYSVKRWINNGRRGGYWQHDYKSEIEDKLAEVSRGHGGHSDWREHGRSPRKSLMFEVNDSVAEAKFDRVRDYIAKRKNRLGDSFPLNDADRKAMGEFEALKQRAQAQAGPLAKLKQSLGLGSPHKFTLGIYSTAKAYGSLDEYRRSQKPLDQRVAEFQGADPLAWTGEKHSKHFEKLIRDTDYDAELNDEYKRLKSTTKVYRERVEDGGAPYSKAEFNEIIRFRELEQGLLAQRGKGEVVSGLAKQIKAEKDKMKEARGLGRRDSYFPQTAAHRDLLKRYDEAKRGNARMNFRSGMGSVASLGARVARWDPWEEGGQFDERKRQEKRTEKARKKYMDADGTPKTDANGLPVGYWRRDAKGKKIEVDRDGELASPLYGHSAFTAWRADEYKIRSRKEYEESDVYKDLQRQKQIREQMHKINSVANANDALRRVGYSDEEIKKFGIGFGTMSKKERSGLLQQRTKLAETIEQKKNMLARGIPPIAKPIGFEGSIRADEIKLAAMDLQLDQSARRKTPKQLEKTEAELNEDFSRLFKIREKMQTGGRLGRYDETEYDVVSGEIESIKKRRRDDQRVLTDKQIMGAAARADGMYDILLRNGIGEEDANAVVNGVPIKRVAGGAKAQKIEDILMEYGPPRIRPRDYAAALRGPSSRFGNLEMSTERSLRGKRKDLFMDAVKLESWLRGLGEGGTLTEREFLDVYSQMDLKTRARTKTALRSLTSRTIGEGIMYGGTGLEGQVKLGEFADERGKRTGEYKQLLELSELKDDTEKIDFVKHLIKNDGLGAYMKEKPSNREEMTDIIDKYWDQFVTEVDTGVGLGLPATGVDDFQALPGLQNELVMDIIKSKTMDAAGLDWETRGAGLIDKQAREDRKAKYVKDLARTRKLASALTGPNGGQLRSYIANHPNRASLGSSPALNLLASGQADQVVSGRTGTALGVLSSLQNGSFMAQFMHLDPSERTGMLDTLRDLKVHNGGESLLDEHTKKRVKTQILKDQGITLDYTGQVALNRKDFDSTDEFFAAKDRRREEHLAQREEKKQAALEARAERIKFGDPARRAREAAERNFRINRDGEINDRVGRGREPLRELENLAEGFIPNLAPPGAIEAPSAMEKQYGAWQKSGQRIPGPTNKFQPQYPGQVPRRLAGKSLEQIVEPFITPTTEDVEKADILGSRKKGYYNDQGKEIGDWDYRGYTRMGDTPGRPASKVLPSLIKGVPAKKGEEYFSINNQWHTMSQFREGRKLKLGGQNVTVMGTKGSEGVMQVQTESGQIVDIPLRGEAAQERTKSHRAEEAMREEVKRAHQRIFEGFNALDSAKEGAKGAKGAGFWSIPLESEPWEFARGFIPNFSPKGQSAVVNEITANRRLGQQGVKPSDVGFVRLNAGRGRSPVSGTMVEKGRHAEDLVKTEVGDFVVPAGGQRGAYANRLKKQADAAGLHGLPAAVMGQANAQGFIPNLQDASVGISNVEEMRGLVERFEGTAQQIATTITEGSMEISHALNIEGKVAGLDQGQLIDALQGAMSDTASIEAGKQIGVAFNDNTLNSEVPPPPTDVPRFNRPGNS